VRRHPQPPSSVGIEACAAEFHNPGQVADAVRGSAVAYLVDSTKFQRRFFTATSYQEGAEKTVRCILS
jgi:hypothetical protein